MYEKIKVKEPESLLNISWLQTKPVEQPPGEQLHPKITQQADRVKQLLMVCSNQQSSLCLRDPASPIEGTFFCKFCSKKFCYECKDSCSWCKALICSNCLVQAKSHATSAEGKGLCPKCVVHCDKCQKPHSKAYIMHRCKKCRSTLCADCLKECSDCKRREHCADCLSDCKACGKILCRSCFKVCFRCQQ